MKLEKNFPSVVKYMGSKTDVLSLIENGINYLGRNYDNVCDLFAGSATLSGALRNKVNVISNDIQRYSAVFAKTYLNNYNWSVYPQIEQICGEAKERADRFNNFFSGYKERFSYDEEFTLEDLNELEEEQRSLIDRTDWDQFDNYYLFVQNYSGTYWSYEQCVWIDSFKYAIDRHKEEEEYYNLLLTCLIYAMAYNSQSTGHYAQYRVPDTESSKEDILIYRRKNITDFFVRKYKELEEYFSQRNEYQFETLALRDVECLKEVPEHTLVYADPPYCFVHYSRFYHVLETLVSYDYPTVKFKGRYRDDRYQSEYCIKTEVTDAFIKMFETIRNKSMDLILSYSNSETNTIAFEKLIELCCCTLNQEICDKNIIGAVSKKCKQFFKNQRTSVKILTENMVDGKLRYEISLMKMPYNHSRMGRTLSKSIEVTEIIVIAKCLR